MGLDFSRVLIALFMQMSVFRLAVLAVLKNLNPDCFCYGYQASANRKSTEQAVPGACASPLSTARSDLPPTSEEFVTHCLQVQVQFA